MNKNKKLGFTLAEVLIVIGIIGVVAALTLPNLNHATGDKETVTKVKKIYASLTDAFDRAEVVYGDYDTWFQGLSSSAQFDTFAKRVTEFMKISKDCGQETGQGCFSLGKVKMISGTETRSFDTSGIGGPPNDYRVITADNMSLLFNAITNQIFVDIDGPNKGANTFGKDIFGFDVKSDLGVVPTGYNWDNFITTCLNYINNANIVNNSGCMASWVIENGNLDYLKVDSTGKCNDSNIILDGTTNTSCH